MKKSILTGILALAAGATGLMAQGTPPAAAPRTAVPISRPRNRKRKCRRSRRCLPRKAIPTPSSKQPMTC